eukprot:6176673-Pleurochrysis_carterae.AAC.3
MTMHSTGCYAAEDASADKVAPEASVADNAYEKRHNLTRCMHLRAMVLLGSGAVLAENVADCAAVAPSPADNMHAADAVQMTVHRQDAAAMVLLKQQQQAAAARGAD